MPTVPIGCVDMWLKFAMAGDPEPMWTSLAYRVEEPPFTHANAVALTAHLVGELKLTMSSEITLLGAVFRIGSDGADIIDEVSFNIQGVVTVASLPNNTAVLVRKVTALGGRRGRGRMFIPGANRDSCTGNGALIPDAFAGWATAIEAFTDGIPAGANVSNPVLLHQSAPFDATDVVTLQLQHQVATQRRRMR